MKLAVEKSILKVIDDKDNYGKADELL